MSKPSPTPTSQKCSINPTLCIMFIASRKLFTRTLSKKNHHPTNKISSPTISFPKNSSSKNWFYPNPEKILNQTNQPKKTTQTVQSQKGPTDFQGFSTFQGPQGPCRRSAATPFRTTLGYWLADHLQLPTGSPPTANRLTVFFSEILSSLQGTRKHRKLIFPTTRTGGLC